MNKKEFVELFAEKSGRFKKESGEIVDLFLETMKDALVENSSLQFVGYFSAEVKETPERLCRNPKTGDDVIVKAHNRIKFKAGKKLKDIVNK